MIIDDPKRQDELAISLRRLNSLAKILKQKRIDSGLVYVSKFHIKCIDLKDAFFLF